MRALALALTMLTLAACEPSGDSGYAADMREEHDGETPTASGATAGAAELPVTGRTVRYADIAGDSLAGFLAVPDSATGPLPGLIVIHEWWGLNDNVRDMTRRLANEGYAALAVDLYGGAVATTPDSAMAIMQRTMADRESAIDNLRQAFAYLTLDLQAPAVGSIGWCFGGGMSLQTALALPDELGAAVIYYGQVETDPALLVDLDMPVLGLFGGADEGIPVESVRAFEAALGEVGVANEIVVYPSADHAFANPSGERYDAEAAEDAWGRVVAFLGAHLTGSSS